jgi:uncharacterized protein YndB with AHSA1/START domain
MEKSERISVTISAKVNAPAAKVWEYWTAPRHITKWNNASEDWHSPRAENNVRTGGRFNIRMEAKDGSAGFDFGGTYDDVKTNELIGYTMDDGRKVKVTFKANGNETQITETFEAEETNPVEMQRMGWQSILDNFKKYTEKN